MSPCRNFSKNVTPTILEYDEYMEKDKITMSKKQLNMFSILSKANAGFITVREASEALGLSERQIKRLKKKVREGGAPTCNR